jgi:4a-hydroxytetrahydrobiopterin dehydratase
MNELLKKKCIPCEAGVEPLTKEEAQNFLGMISGWELAESNKKISKEYKFKDFIGSINFVNKISLIAEEEGHHPDIAISYNKVRLDLSTHAIDGLSENDFILASKIDAN